MEKELKGIFPYLVTPVDKNGNIKEEALCELVEYLIECGVHGLVPLGSTGEFFYLSNEQKQKVVEIVLKQSNKRVPVIAGVASASTLDAIKQAQLYEKMGVDGILIVLNVYFPLSQKDIYNYFYDVASSVSCPVVIYNNPKFTNFDISSQTLEELSKLPNIKYYKDASANTGKLFETKIKTEGKLSIFSASAHVPVFVMMMGGSGWMSGPACVIPKESIKLYQLCVDKKWKEAMEYQKKLWKMNEIFQKYNLAACIKYALNIQGFDVGDPIEPNSKLSDLAKQDIENVLIDLQGSNYKIK